MTLQIQLCSSFKKERQKLTWKPTLRKAYIEIIISNFFLQGGSDPCLNLNPDNILVHPRFLMHPRIGCIIFNFYPSEYDLILGFSLHLDLMRGHTKLQCSDDLILNLMLGDCI